MKNEIAKSAAQATPPLGGNLWIWLNSHDINWYVAAATIAFIALQAYYLIRNKGLKS
jgi:hypothetical protein